MPKVLIVDDDTAFLESLVDGLEQYGDDYSYLTVSNGREALDALAQGGIATLITDLKMPKMDGFELIARVVKDHPELPCIVMTAYGTVDIERAFNEYSIAYIEKPIDIDQLHKLILRAQDSFGREGQLKGVSLASFLQMVEMEQKTCAIEVHSSIWGETGVLRFAKGKLFDATLGDFSPDEAALKILAWQDVNITIKKQRPVFKRRIQSELMELQMEAVRLADEARKDSPAAEPVLKAVSLDEVLVDLEELSTLGGKLPESSSPEEETSSAEIISIKDRSPTHDQAASAAPSIPPEPVSAGDDPLPVTFATPKKEEVMPSQAQTILEEAAKQMDGLLAAGVVGMDGIHIAAVNPAKLPPEMQDAFGVKFALVSTLVRRTLAEIGQGALDEVIVEHEGGWFLLRMVNKDYYFGCAVAKGSVIGNTRMVARQVCEKLSPVL